MMPSATSTSSSAALRTLAGRRVRRAFSLVEVTLALAIVSFALVAIIGVIPAAVSSGRQSFNQNRAATIANTLFTSFRSQPFSSVGYLDDQFTEDGVTMSGGGSAPTLNLNQLDGAPGSVRRLYASFLDVPTDAGVQADNFGDQRRLCFTADRPANAGVSYLVIMQFNNHPDGLMVDPAAHGAVAQANHVGITVTPATVVPDNPALAQAQFLSRRGDLEQYHFGSTIANREH